MSNDRASSSSMTDIGMTMDSIPSFVGVKRMLRDIGMLRLAEQISEGVFQMGGNGKIPMIILVHPKDYLAFNEAVVLADHITLKPSDLVPEDKVVLMRDLIGIGKSQ